MLKTQQLIVNNNNLDDYFTIDYITLAYDIVAFSILEVQYYHNSIRAIPPTELQSLLKNIKFQSKKHNKAKNIS